MSTELTTLKNTGSRKVDMTVTQFAGPVDVGPCLQLSAQMELGDYGYVQLNAEDMLKLNVIFSKLIEDTPDHRRRRR